MGHEIKMDSDDYYARETEIRELQRQGRQTFAFITQLVNKEIPIDDVRINGGDIRVIPKESPADVSVSPDVPGGSVDGDAKATNGTVRGSTDPEPETALAGSKGNPRRGT